MSTKRRKALGAGLIALGVAAAAALLGQGITGGGGSTSVGAAVGYCNVGSISGSNPTPSGQGATFDAGHCGNTAGTYTYFDGTLSGNVTSSSITGLTAGQHYTFRIIQNGSTAFTFTPPASWTNPPSVSTVLGAYVIFSGVWNGSALISLPATSSQGFGQGGTMVAPTACPSAPNAFFSWFDPIAHTLTIDDPTNCVTPNTPGQAHGMDFLTATFNLTQQNASISNTALATQPAGSAGYWIVGTTLFITTGGTAGTLAPRVSCTDDSPNTGTNFTGATVGVTGTGTSQTSTVGWCEVKAGQAIFYSVQTAGFTAGSLKYTVSGFAKRLL